jgi:hypothetical protein
MQMQLELWHLRLPLIHAVCGNEWPCTGSRHGEMARQTRLYPSTSSSKRAYSWSVSV